MAFDYIIYDLKADLSSNSSFIADATNQREMHTLHLQIVCLSTCFYVVYIHYCKSVQSAKAATVNSYTSEHVISEFFFGITS